MPLQTNDQLTQWMFSAGEPVHIKMFLADHNKVPEDLTGRAFALGAWNASGDVGSKIDGTVVMTGEPHILFLQDGTFSKALDKKGQLNLEISELLNGETKETISKGQLMVASSHPAITGISGGPISRHLMTIRRYNDASNSEPAKYEVAYGAVPVPVPPPAFSVQPSVSPSSGTVGATFSGVDGTITNGTVTARQWLSNGVVIPGATGTTYVSAAAGSLSFKVTASGDGGTSSATSSPITVAAPVFTPVNTAAPTITGTPNVGSVLTTSNGNWSNGPTAYSYQWLRNGVEISGATSLLYTLVSADAGTSITSRVKASNSAGNASADSSAVVVPIVAVPNTLTVSPSTATVGTAATFTISGTANGSTLTGVAIPAGMTLNSSGRKITGTPTTDGAFDIIIDETPDGGGAANRSTIRVNIAPATAPALGANPSSASISTATPAGSQVFLISNVPAGVTPTISDSGFVVAGDATSGWRVVTGLNPIAAGTINLTVSATGATSVVVPITVTAVATTPAALASPTPVDGVVGGDSLYPQGSVLKGPNASVFAVGSGLSNGDQVVRLFDHATGSLIETRTVRAIDGKDDHKGVCVAAYSSGAFTAFATGHNNLDDFRVFFSDRAPDGTWTEQTISYPQRVTYPTGLLDKNEQLMFFLRVNNNTWTLRYRNGFAGTFGAPVTFVTHPNQLYFQSPRYDPVTHRVYANVRVNDDEADQSGRIKLVEFDCATGEWFDANGGLGKMDGTASANGKKLPFAYLDIAIQFDKSVDANGNAYAAYRVEDRSYDGRRMIVRTSIDSTLSPDGKDKNEVRVWQCPTGSRMNPANWSQGPLIYNMEKTAAGGPKCRFDVSPKPSTSIRFFGERGFTMGSDVWWQLSRYDSTNNGATWTETIMEQSPMLILHQCPLENAVETTPVPYLQYTAFQSYNVFTRMATRFFRPTRVKGPIVLLDSFTEATDVDLSTHTPEVGGTYTRKAAVSSTNPVMVSATQNRLYATSTAQYNNSAVIPAGAKKVRATVKLSALGSTDNTVVTGVFADTTAYSEYTFSVRRSTGALGVNRTLNGTQLTVISATRGGAVEDGDCIELEIDQIDDKTRKLTLLYNGLIMGTPYTDTAADAISGRTIDYRFATATTTANGGLAPTATMVQVVE